MKNTFKLVMILLLILMCSTLSGCFWIFDSPNGEGGGGGKDNLLTEEYEYKFNVAGDEFAFTATVTIDKGSESAEFFFKRNGAIVKRGMTYSVENNEIDIFDIKFALSDGGRLVSADLITDEQSEIIYSYELLAGNYAPSHEIYGATGNSELILKDDGTARFFDSDFTYYPLYSDTVVLLNSDNDGIVIILDYSKQSFEIETKTAATTFEGGEYIESYYDFLYGCEKAYQGEGSFKNKTLFVLGELYYMTDFKRSYTIGRATLNDGVLSVFTSESDSYKLELDEENASFDYALEREFTNGNYYVNIYYNGEIYIQTLYTGGECRIVCELGEGRVPVLYHPMTDTTYVFDNELNAVASFDGEYYVDSSDARIYTSVVADSAGNKKKILIDNDTKTAYQINYSTYGYPQYVRDENAEVLSDNLLLINSAYHFLTGDEYFSLYGYEMGTVSSAVVSCAVHAVPGATIHTESDNAYKDDTVLEIENAYCALISMEDGTAIAILTRVVPSEYYGQALETQKCSGKLVFSDGNVAVINEALRTTFVQISENNAYVRRTYPVLQNPDLVAQNEKYYSVKSGSIYYVFDKDFVLKYEIDENNYTGLGGLE
ncbi:MAG: hypothetical protein E7676_04665 [Ruminococcaceae bacterium]|nr:hypothetical protein [Oscillospiraceae bacterium]